MDEITLEKVNLFTSGDYKDTPQCSICNQKNCYIIIKQKVVKNVKSHFIDQVWRKNEENEQNPPQIFKNIYFYSPTCKTCVQDISREYITDREVMKFIDNQCVSAQKCLDCGKKLMFYQNK